MKEIILSRGKIALIDDEDYARVRKYSWCIHSSRYKDLFYAKARINGKNVLLHRFILRPSKTLVVDHINGDGLDNRRFNLRVTTDALNKLNRRNCKGYNRQVAYGKNGEEYPGFCVKMSYKGKECFRKWVKTEKEAKSLVNSKRLELRNTLLAANI
ncbi:MAG TPA: hypothetical protein VNX68_03225 [Nitrosopumilaceae archaeon]|jgi:hypothetical protein|nr:hypothetical protein [Nitrosopumilaceae archaeon]